MKICLFGHPFAPIGMGELIASFSDAMENVYLKHSIYDIYAMYPHENRPWLSDKITDELNDYDVRIFHINGDEIGDVFAALEAKGFDRHAAYNVIVPAWELPHYPEAWRNGINEFDEVWSFSHYIEAMFAGWTRALVRYCGMSAERRHGVLRPRKYFGIKGSSFVYLAFFDQSSYFSRKNPEAVIALYRQLRERYPFGDFQLVVKAKNLHASSDYKLHQVDENIVYINENLSYDEVTSLIDCCDVFISLHRAEGFGRGAAEAVLRNRMAIITGYSGVEDFMADSAIRSVGYRLVDVEAGEYPYHQGQQWAEPDLSEAVAYATELFEMHLSGGSVQKYFDESDDAGLVVRGTASNLSVGINIVQNLEAISAKRSDHLAG